MRRVFLSLTMLFVTLLVLSSFAESKPFTTEVDPVHKGVQESASDERKSQIVQTAIKDLHQTQVTGANDIGDLRATAEGATEKDLRQQVPTAVKDVYSESADEAIVLEATIKKSPRRKLITAINQGKPTEVPRTSTFKKIYDSVDWRLFVWIVFEIFSIFLSLILWSQIHKRKIIQKLKNKAKQYESEAKDSKRTTSTTLLLNNTNSDLEQKNEDASNRIETLNTFLKETYQYQRLV